MRTCCVCVCVYEWMGEGVGINQFFKQAVQLTYLCTLYDFKLFPSSSDNAEPRLSTKAQTPSSKTQSGFPGFAKQLKRGNRKGPPNLLLYKAERKTYGDVSTLDQSIKAWSERRWKMLETHAKCTSVVIWRSQNHGLLVSMLRMQIVSV